MANVDGTPIAVPTDLEAAGAYINSCASQMAEELSQLWAQLEPLSVTWTGAAQTYYEGLQQEWNTAAAGLFSPDGVLGQIASAMNVNWGNYSEAEASNTKTWQSAS
jgi:WXG100 family type VII secretion target